MQEKEQGSIVDAGKTGAEAASEPLFIVFTFYEVGFRFPLYPERRIGKHIFEPVVREAVVGETVPEGDMLDILTLDHHVGTAYGVCLGIIVLSEDLEIRIRVELAHILLGYGQHATRAACRVIKFSDDPLCGEDVGIGHKEEIYHEADDLTRGEVIAGCLV